MRKFEENGLIKKYQQWYFQELNKFLILNKWFIKSFHINFFLFYLIGYNNPNFCFVLFAFSSVWLDTYQPLELCRLYYFPFFTVCKKCMQIIQKIITQLNVWEQFSVQKVIFILFKADIQEAFQHKLKRYNIFVRHR
jgi:hypothetical protein